MKKYLTTIIALAVIVVLLTAFFIVKKAGLLDPNAEATEDPYGEVETGSVFAFLSRDESTFSKVVKIESVVDGESLTLEKIGDTWKATSHPDLAIVSKNVNSCLTSMRSLNGRVAYSGEVTESKRYEFGFEESTTYIELTLSDGTSSKVIYGKLNQSGSSGYTWEYGSERVYLVDNYQRTSALVDAVDLLDTKIFSFNDSGQISRVNISKDGSDYLKLQAIFSAEADVARSWQVKYPLDRAGNTSTIEALITSLTSTNIADVEKLGCDDLSQYGLKPAKMKVSVADSNKTITLSIGDMTADRTYYYVTVDNASDVYLVKTSAITFTDTPQLNFMNEYIFMLTYTQLKQVDIEVLGRNYVLTYDATGDREDEVFTINGTNVYYDEERDFRSEFKRIGTAMYGLRLSGLADEPAEKGELLCRIRYEERDGTVNIVECYAREGSTMYFYLNGVYQGGYGSRYLLDSDGENYGITGTIDHLYEVMGVEDPEAAK